LEPAAIRQRVVVRLQSSVRHATRSVGLPRRISGHPITGGNVAEALDRSRGGQWALRVGSRRRNRAWSRIGPAEPGDKARNPSRPRPGRNVAVCGGHVRRHAPDRDHLFRGRSTGRAARSAPGGWAAWLVVSLMCKTWPS